MKITGFDGLATAVILLAAKDYADKKRWLLAHAKTKCALSECAKLREEKDQAVIQGKFKRAMEIQRTLHILREQERIETEIQEIMDFFESQMFHNIATFSGKNFIKKIDYRLEHDKSFRLKFTDEL